MNGGHDPDSWEVYMGPSGRLLRVLESHSPIGRVTARVGVTETQAQLESGPLVQKGGIGATMTPHTREEQTLRRPKILLGTFRGNNVVHTRKPRPEGSTV